MSDDNVLREVRNIPSILVHHNQRRKAIEQYDFKKLGIKKIVHHNQMGFNIYRDKFGTTEDLVHIPLCVDLDEFQFSDVEPENPAVGIVGRIVEWKRPAEIIRATRELGLKNLIMGMVNDIVYFDKIKAEGVDHVKWDFWDCPSEARKDAYRNMTIYVGYSDDSRETGTLGLLEAMASGVPVITTRAGIAGEIIDDGINGLIIEYDDSYEELKEKIKLLIEDKELRATLRKNAWNTVKNMPEVKMAWKFNQLWHETAFPDEPIVSVIIPATYDRAPEINSILQALEEQSYRNFEAIVIWDEVGEKDFEFRKFLFPIKELKTGRDGYNLAMARNMGICESAGEILVFCDSRLEPDPDSLMMFQQAVDHAGEITQGGNKKVWFFGDKGSGKKSFVENFSAVKKEFLVVAGCFSERVNEYGGMSQELRTRWIKQGGLMTYLPSAVAKEIKSSKMTPEKRKSIIKMKQLLFQLYNDDRF